MKIDDLLRLLPPVPGASPSRRPDEDFAPYLHSALGSRPGEVLVVPPPPRVAGVPPAASAPAAALEAGLSRLEALARGLAEPTLTLRDLEPLVRELLQDSHRLTALARNLDPSSPLRALTEETAALAYVESLKFQRGDYL